MQLCTREGLVIRLTSGLRTPLEQAALWRMGRGTSVINAKIEELKSQSAPYLALCIDKAGPQNGPWRTNALPGYSWHNWGLGADFMCFNMKGDPIQNGDAYEYRVFQRMIPFAGLHNYGKDWIKDAGHVQFYELSPSSKYTLAEMDKLLSEKYPIKADAQKVIL